MTQTQVRATVATMFGVILVFAVLQESEAGYGNGQALEAYSTTPLKAGRVTGKVGVLVNLTSTGGGTSLATTGVVGAQWDGTQLENSGDGPKQGGADAWHDYYWNGWGETRLTMSISSNASVSGSAHRAGPGTWWWDSTNSVEADEPTAEAYVPGEGYRDLEFMWSTYALCDAQGGDAANNNNPNTTPPSSISAFTGSPVTNGTVEESVVLPDEEGTRVTVQASWGAEAEGDVDNAVVSLDKLALTIGMSTSVSEE